MKRKLMSVLLVLAMALTLLPAAAMAATVTVENGVASVSSLDELKSALETEDAATIKLTQDITGVNTPLEVKRAVTIDFDGKKVSGGISGGEYIFKVGKDDGGTYTTLAVTFQNAKIENTETNNGRCLEVKPGVTLTIDGDQTSVSGSGNVIVNAGILNINAGQYTCTDTNDSRNVILTGSDVYKDHCSTAVTTIKNATLTNDAGIGASALWGATINVEAGAQITAHGNALGGNNTTPPQIINVKEGAKLTSTADAAIYQAAEGTLTITGGEIKGVAGVVARAGIVNITGGTITATGTGEVKVGDRTEKVPASGIVYDQKANYPSGSQNSKVTVSGEAVVKAAGQAVTLVLPDSSSSDPATNKLEVKGGSFDKVVDPKYLPTDTYQVKNSAGTSYKYFDTKDAAFAAAGTGDEITKKTDTPTTPGQPMEPIAKPESTIKGIWTAGAVSGVGEGKVTVSGLETGTEYIVKIARGDTNVYVNMTAQAGKLEVICQADAVLSVLAKANGADVWANTTAANQLPTA